MTVSVYTAKPGILIGRKGAAVKVLRQKLEQLTGSKVKLEVEEITQPDLEAKLVADNIAAQLAHGPHDLRFSTSLMEGRRPTTK